MDEAIAMCCPNCSQLYQIKTSHQKKNLPLFLSCGHSMCENCISTLVKFAEPIECKICHRDMQVTANEVALLAINKMELYQLFPVNMLLLGELGFQRSEQHSTKNEADCFINLQEIIKKSDATQGQCIECHHSTTKQCRQCASILCDNCFNKSHKNFVIFKNHVLEKIEPVMPSKDCKFHKNRTTDYFCKDCEKPICMDCLVVDKNCATHTVVSMIEMNESLIEQLSDLAPKVDETYKRLTKTGVDVGHILLNMKTEAGSTSELTVILSQIEQHFSKLVYAIQKHKKEVTDIIMKLKHSEKESLIIAKKDITDAIIDAKKTLNMLNTAVDPAKADKINLAVLLEDAKRIAAAPWYLSKDESRDPLKVAVNEDLCTLITDYIQLEGNASTVYKLVPTSELGEDVKIPPPPNAPVFPPELCKDVRQSHPSKPKDSRSVSRTSAPTVIKDVPTYRKKSGSVTSLNSADSDSSYRSSMTNYSTGDFHQRPVVQSVPPFAESQPEKQLDEGAQEVVYITHIVDPHNFFVQRLCHQRVVKDMIREFRNATKLPKPSLNHVAEGKIYLMFNTADRMWQRCRIISIDRGDPNNPMFKVFSIDFGSTEITKVDNLRLMAPAWVQMPYPLAINCSLANIKPKTGVWSNDDSYLIQNIIDNKQAVIHVHSVSSTPNSSLTVVCDVTTFHEGLSIAHALVFHERAMWVAQRPKYPKHPSVQESDKPKIYMGNYDFPPQSEEDVYITHVVSPDKFYVRKEHMNNVYQKLSESLNQEYSLNNNAGSVYLPEVGGVYVVNLDKYRDAVNLTGWARCTVTELPGRGRVRLRLVDLGAALLAHWAALRHIHTHFTTLRALAIECYLSGVTPPKKRWSPKSVALMQQWQNWLLRMRVEEARPGQQALGAVLYNYPEDGPPLCLNQEMIRHKFAISFGLAGFDQQSVGRDKDRVYTNKTPLDQPQPKPKKKSIQILRREELDNEIETKHVDEQELKAKDKGPLRLEAKLLHYQSPSLFYLSFNYQDKKFKTLFEEIQKHYKTIENEPQEKTDWKVGDKCCTLCQASQTWRRALVENITGDTARIFYIDFACVETVPVTKLREIDPKLTKLGNAAIKCHLCGILSAHGDDWPTITKEFLKELLDAYPRIFVTKWGDFKEHSMPVELWVYHTIQGGALEPNKAEWRCLNRKIIEQGLAVPDKSQPLAESTSSKEDGITALLKDVTTSIDSWLDLESRPMKPLVVDSPASPRSSSPADYAQPSTSTADTIYISDWLPPEPLKSKEFTAIPTYIDNDGVIYLHDVSQAATLELIRKALDQRFSRPDPKAPYARWAVGEPCVALYFLDSRFYRGRVLQVQDGACLVHYVDYGNDELCDVRNMRKFLALHNIPVQASRATLARVRPPGPPPASWPRATLDYVHQSVVEKQCYVRVVAEPQPGLLAIDLKYDKLWINDHLVDFEMAEYTDGTKPAVRKFAAVEVEAVAVESDSGPDYLVDSSETEGTVVSQESFDVAAMAGRDWNDILREDADADEAEAGDGDEPARYPRLELAEFRCEVQSVGADLRTLQLTLVHDDDTAKLYEEMYESIEASGASLPPLSALFGGQACAARYGDEDGAEGGVRWYRAAVLQASARERRVRVLYVDYGNKEVVAQDELRALPRRWCALPPCAVEARLAGVAAAGAEAEAAAAALRRVLAAGPFRARVLSREPTLTVELRDEHDKLVADTLIESGIFMKSDDETCD